MRVLLVDDEPYMTEAIRDGLRLEARRQTSPVRAGSVPPRGPPRRPLRRANADPCTNAVRITVSGLRKGLGEPGIIATVAGAAYRISTEPEKEAVERSRRRTAPPPPDR